MQSLFITATGTNVGKTYTTIKLIAHFASLGLRVGVYKPIETGVIDVPSDASLLLSACQKVNTLFSSLEAKDITAYTFALPSAPFCADIHKQIKIEKIQEKYDELSGLCDILLVEGAGGLFVPIQADFMMIELIEALKIPKTLLVTPSRLGCINDTLLSQKALKSLDIDFDWCVNLYEDKEDFAQVTQPFYDEVFPSWKKLGDDFEGFSLI
jgi:dethiobiotin synthetase